MSDAMMEHNRPSRVLRLIVDHHKALLERLDELARFAKRLSDGDPDVLAHAVALSSQLCDELLDDIALESYFLVPVLRDIDAWGDSRAETLLHRLNSRRHEIDLLLTACANGDSDTLGSIIERFVEDRRSAMAWAESGLLNVLRDDIVSIDAEGG